jgi:hypothetical protein
MGKIRLEHELAESIDKWGWKYHHLISYLTAVSHRLRQINNSLW